MRHIWMWSLAIGGATSLFVLLLLATGPGHHDLLFNGDILLTVVAIAFMQTRVARGTSTRFTYLRTFGSGALAALVAAGLSRLTYFLYLAFVDDSLFGMLKDQWREALAGQGLDGAAIDERLASLQLSAGSFAWGNLIAFLVPVLLLTALVSIFTRDRSKTTSEEPSRTDGLEGERARR